LRNAQALPQRGERQDASSESRHPRDDTLRKATLPKQGGRFVCKATELESPPPKNNHTNPKISHSTFVPQPRKTNLAQHKNHNEQVGGEDDHQMAGRRVGDQE
jgi:hypothetical protein